MQAIEFVIGLIAVERGTGHRLGDVRLGSDAKDVSQFPIAQPSRIRIGRQSSPR